MRKHNIENTLIISLYDGGYAFSVMIDGSILTKEDGRLKEIYDDCGCYPSYDDIYELQKKYNRDVLLCENGNIEFFPIKK